MENPKGFYFDIGDFCDHCPDFEPKVVKNNVLGRCLNNVRCAKDDGKTCEKSKKYWERTHKN